MTRTKRQLILSYSDSPSRWLENACDVLTLNNWTDHVDLQSLELHGVPEMLPDIAKGRSVLQLTGFEFLYSSQALGLSLDLQERIASLVDGRGLFQDGRRLRWRTMGDALSDVRKNPSAKQLFGPRVHKEFLDLFDGLETP